MKMLNKEIYTVEIENFSQYNVLVGIDVVQDPRLLVLTTVGDVAKIFDNTDRSYVPDSFLVNGSLEDIDEIMLILKGDHLSFDTFSLFDINNQNANKLVTSINNLHLSFPSFEVESQLVIEKKLDLFFYKINVKDIKDIRELSSIFTTKHEKETSLKINFYNM